MTARPLPAPGDEIRVRDQRWRVLRCRPHGACAILDVAASDAAGRARATFLLPFERVDAVSSARRPRRVRPPEWRRVARRVLADAVPAWWSLRSATTARISLLAFQLEPAIALARGTATRMLIADAVGLGKTIQAGLMVAETLERSGTPHVLIVCPASLRAQWVEELAERFALTARMLDAPGLAAARYERPADANPWSTEPLIVTSVDFIKRPDVIRALERVVWDLVVFDEAHMLDGRSDRATAATSIANRARALVLLTATPHSGDDDAFARLCGIGALPGDPPLRVFRRDRTSLASPHQRREARLRVQPTDAEGRMHAGLADYAALASRERQLPPGGLLALSVLSRRATSSAASLARSLERRIALLSGTAVDAAAGQASLPFLAAAGDDAEPGAELEGPALSDRVLELQLLHGVLALATTAARHESKILALHRFLRRTREPAIVFTQYRDTLGTVAATLPDGTPQLHGGMTPHERHTAARAFTHGDARVLLATDAASEGLNLHYRCRLVINLELPWTPLRLEQRAGRVDRLGQQRRVHAVRLVAAGTTEEGDASRIEQRAAHADDAVPVAGGLSADAAAECCRIERARILHSHSAAALPHRPIVTTIARRRLRNGPSSLTAFRLPFVDGDSCALWDCVVGITGLPDPRSTDVTRLLEELARVRAIMLTASLQNAVSIRSARERAIAQAIRRSHARLSAGLLQPALFDRRAERAADAQARVLADALAETEAQIAALAARCQVQCAAPQPVFSVVRA